MYQLANWNALPFPIPPFHSSHNSEHSHVKITSPTFPRSQSASSKTNTVNNISRRRRRRRRRSRREKGSRGKLRITKNLPKKIAALHPAKAANYESGFFSRRLLFYTTLHAPGQVSKPKKPAGIWGAKEWGGDGEGEISHWDGWKKRAQRLPPGAKTPPLEMGFCERQREKERKRESSVASDRICAGRASREEKERERAREGKATLSKPINANSLGGGSGGEELW